MGFSVRIYNCYDVKGLQTVLVATHHDSRDLGSSEARPTSAWSGNRLPTPQGCNGLHVRARAILHMGIVHGGR